MVNFWQALAAAAIAVSILFALMLLVYYIVTYRGMKAKKQHFTDLHQSLAPGQKVEFANGLVGKVKTVSDEICQIEVKSGAILEVSRYAISRRLDG